MRAAVTIAAKDLRQRLRDRSAWLVGLLVPLALAAVLDVTFGSGDEQAFVPNYAIAVEDDGPLGAAFASLMDALEAEGTVTVTRAADPEAAGTLVRDGEVAAGIVVPAGFSAAATGPGTVPALRVIGTSAAPLSAEVAKSIANGFLDGIESRRLAVATALSVSAGEASPATLATAVQDLREPFALVEGRAADAQLDQTTYLAVGLAIFFVFFTVQFGVLSYLEESRDGTLARLRAAPVAPWAPLAGKALASVTVGIVSLATLVLATSVLLGADWGPLVAVIPLILAGVLSSVGLLGLIAAFARTPEQAGVWQSVLAVLLAALGGVFFDVTQGSEVLERLSLLTPHQWLLRGVGAARADGLTGALPAVGALLVFAVVGAALGWLIGRRREALT